MTLLAPHSRATLIAAARAAAAHAYAPYSRFPVGAALLFEDGAVVTGSNVENASYGLSLCAETVAVATALGQGRRGGLAALAIFTPTDQPATPCGRCRQVLTELAQLGGTDPLVICLAEAETVETLLSTLLPRAFGPSNLA